MAVVRNAPEEQTRCRRVRAGSSDVSTVSWWSDIFTTLISGKGRGRCCGNFFFENQKAISCLDINITIAHVNPLLSRQWKKTDLWSKRWAHSVYRENMHGGTSSLLLVATVKKKKCFFAHDERKRQNLKWQKLQVKKRRHFHCMTRKFIRPAGEWFAAHVIQVSSFLTDKSKVPWWERMSIFTLPYFYILCNGRQEWLKGLQNECQSKVKGWKQLLIYFMVFVSFSRLYALWILTEGIKTINDSSILYFTSYIMR